MGDAALVFWVIAGALGGAGAAVPLLLAARLSGRGHGGIGVALAAVGASFLLLHAIVMAVRLVCREAALPCGCAAALTFLAVSVARALSDTRPRD